MGGILLFQRTHDTSHKDFIAQWPFLQDGEEESGTCLVFQCSELLIKGLVCVEALAVPSIFLMSGDHGGQS